MTFQTYEDMDITLAKLHSPSLIANETKVLGPFGVFQGTEKIPKKTRANKRKRKDTDLDSSNSTPTSSSSTVSTPLVKPVTRHNLSDDSALSNSPLKASTTLPSQNINITSKESENLLLDFQSTENNPSVSLDSVESGNSSSPPINLLDLHLDTVSYDQNSISNGELDSEQNSNSQLFTQILSNDFISPATNPILNHQHIQNPSTSTQQNASNGISNAQHNVNNDNNSNNNNNSNTEQNENEDNLVMIPTINLVNNFLSTDFTLGFPTNSLHFSPEARKVLHHYINQVSKIMTVVTHDSTPWKKIYLPRAINAIGSLTALGITTPARNSLLHALLSVSSFHLASKYPENSERRNHFTKFAQRLKKTAARYLSQCKATPTSDLEHKDMMTAVLSMVSIDVFSGEMAACSRHLKSCKKYILTQRNSSSENSKETKVLYRIYSFLNLLQDSTNITPDRLDSSVLDDSEWNYIREMEDLGLDSSIETASAMDSDVNFPNFDDSRNNNSLSHNLSVFNNSHSDHSMPHNITSTDFLHLDFSCLEGFESNMHFGANSPISDSDNQSNVYNGNNQLDWDAMLQDLSSFGNNLGFPVALSPSRTADSSSSLPSKNIKNFYEAEIVSTYAMYGIPDSLTILFSRVVKLARQGCYLKAVGKAPPKLLETFKSKYEKIDIQLHKWLTEFKEHQIPPEFTQDTRVAFYLHTIAFYHSLVIYHCTVTKDINSENLQDTVRLVLKYLQRMLELNRNRECPVIVPLLFPAFIAACEACDEQLAQDFDKWFDQMTIDGLGTYSQAREVVKEVWRRRRHGLPNQRWYEIIHESNINILLS